MNNEKRAYEFRRLLASIDFDKRYYAFVDSHKSSFPMKGVRQEHLALAIAKAELSFDYVKKEKFYEHLENFSMGEVGLNLFLSDYDLEAIFAFHSPSVGGSFHELALDIGEMRDPNFSPQPPYPRLPFSNINELQEAVNLVVQLFKEGRELILSYDGWDK